jgi:hypothetical protein
MSFYSIPSVDKIFVFSIDSKPALMPTKSYNQRIFGKEWSFLGGKVAESGS